MPPALSFDDAPNLAECARLTVSGLVPLIATRLCAAVDAGDQRADAEDLEEDEEVAEDGDGDGRTWAGEVKKVRWEDRVDRARRRRRSQGAQDLGEGPSTARRGDGGQEEDRQHEQGRGTGMFFARDRPGITIEAYLTRITTYAPIPLDAVLLAMVYLNRISRYSSTVSSDALFPSVPVPPCPPRDPNDVQPDVPLDSRTIHRLLLSTLLIAAKFASDAYIPHARAAKVCGVPGRDLHRLEVEIFKLLGWSLYWDMEEVEAVAKSLVRGDWTATETEDVEMDEQAPVVTTPASSPPLAGAFGSPPPRRRPVPVAPRRSSFHSANARSTTPPPQRAVNFVTPSPTPTPPSSSAPSTPSPPGTPGSPYSAKSGRSSRSNTSRGSRSKSTTPRLVVAAAVEGLADELREGMMLDPAFDAGEESDEWYSDVEEPDGHRVMEVSS